MRSLVFLLALPLAAADRIPVLIIDGQNNHQWKLTTPLLKQFLEEAGMFQVDVATTPEKGGDMKSFRPDFGKYKVVVSNYNGEDWGSETQQAFEQFVQKGGGFVSFHAADNAFPTWKAYNEMIGLGGWGGRTEAHGPYMRLKDGKWTRDMKPGKGGHHGKQHAYQVTVRNAKHPITAGLPGVWMHASDELYDSLRGPAENMTVLATSFSAPETGGTGEHEPALMVIQYGKGRIFHTTLGHSPEAMRSVDFILTYQRGVQWAATGKATIKVPSDFPVAERVSVRP